MSTDSTSGSPRFLLADEDWLRAQSAVQSDGQIAAHLGVSRSTVIRARVSFGIPGRPRGGSERGQVRRMAVRQPPRPIEMQLADRIVLERSIGAGASEELIGERTAGYVSAKTRGHLTAMIDQALSAAAAWALVAEQLQARAAAAA